MNEQSILLSVGIIFRDDIRCVERCLKALQPLRDAIPCELVMADTGSVDGSREIAEKYADLVFDFPWINDFASARNAVMDRCTGKWFLTVDTDEYLQSDVSELTEFLKRDTGQEDFCIVMIRNHDSYDMDGDYSDFMALRMVRMSTGSRYAGSIHESLMSTSKEQRIRALPRSIFDHDGYVGMATTKEGKAKRERNLKLLRQRIIEEPKSLALHLETLDCAVDEPDFPELVRNAVKVVKEKPYGWEKMGPSVLRNAIFAADVKELPERDEWIELAEDWFPMSLYTRVDVQFARLVIALREKRYEECVQRGESYLKAMDAYHAGANIAELMYGILSQAGPVQEQRGKIALADACCNTGRLERTIELLSNLDYTKLDRALILEMMATLQELQYKSNIDTAPLITAVWEGVSEEKPSKEKSLERLDAFLQVAGLAFVPENREKERKKESFFRPSYTLYLPLRGKCEVGSAASILEENNPKEIEAILSEIDDWTRFPIHVLTYALEQGVSFPLLDNPLNIEVMDALAGRLSGDQKHLFPIVKELFQNRNEQDVQQIAWLRSLTLAAEQIFPWSTGETDKENGLAIARAFSQVEKIFLPLCYSSSILTKKHLFLLPPMHRFGWYCAQAFDALDAGDTAGYVHLLREGLLENKQMKPMVEFLLNYTPELQEATPDAELQALAEQIRTVLANFAPDDPAVETLKQSEAYQKVAYLIEGMEVPVMGGLLQ